MTLIWTDFILFGSFQRLPGLGLAPLKGYFETTQCPSRATTSPRAAVVKLQRYKDTVQCVMQGAEVPRHHHTVPKKWQTVLVNWGLKERWF